MAEKIVLNEMIKEMEDLVEEAKKAREYEVENEGTAENICESARIFAEINKVMAKYDSVYDTKHIVNCLEQWMNLPEDESNSIIPAIDFIIKSGNEFIEVLKGTK